VHCLYDGDEYIHLVEVKKGSGGPTPTPTQTLVGATIQGSVTLQGRPAKPHARWVVPLTVSVGGTDYPVTTDQQGAFTLPGLTTGTYDIAVKNIHTLRNRMAGVTLAPGTNALDFGTLLEGDASNDNCVNITDFSILKLHFLGYDPSSDFNQDGVVNITDFSMLVGNFMTCGDIPVSSSASALGGGSAKAAAAQGSPVQISIQPERASVLQDQVFAINLVIAAGEQLIDGAEVHLDFDPSVLQVVDTDGNPVASIEAGSMLDVPIQNLVDNQGGRIDFAAGTFDSQPSGTFVLGTARLKALHTTDSQGTAVAFVSRAGSPTDVAYNGYSVLGSTSDALVTVRNSFRIFLPRIGRR
jgi:hypothetical protein